MNPTPSYIKSNEPEVDVTQLVYIIVSRIKKCIEGVLYFFRYTVNCNNGNLDSLSVAHPL